LPDGGFRAGPMNARYDEIIASLRGCDYVADTDIATSLFLAEHLNKPILIEGEAGVGKTEIARVLAKLKNTELIRLQCYEGLDFNAALYEWNYQKQIMSIRLNELKGNADLSIGDLYSEDYLLHRPILKALLAKRRTVLLLDEIDRADEEFEALLLETLAEYQLTIPELGTIRTEHAPYVILTSNRTRELTDALRRRCLYLWIAYPSFQKELEVIQLKVPAIGEAFAIEVTTFVQALRREKLNKVPGLSEAIDWARALQATGVRVLERAGVENTVGVLLKDRQDVKMFRDTMLGAILEKVGGGNRL
jgi:MoxR-like ATPase